MHKDSFRAFAKVNDNAPNPELPPGIDWEQIVKRTFCTFWLVGIVGKNFLKQNRISVEAQKDEKDTISIDDIVTENGLTVLLFRIITLMVKYGKFPVHSDISSYLQVVYEGSLLRKPELHNPKPKKSVL
jgi:hypothetical protein